MMARGRLPDERMRWDGEYLHLHLMSLNEFVTCASLALEPNRPSVGGSVYRNVFWQADGDWNLPVENHNELRLTHLDYVRTAAEAGGWPPREPAIPERPGCNLHRILTFGSLS